MTKTKKSCLDIQLTLNNENVEQVKEAVFWELFWMKI
jgi:hypothetical protein